MRMPEPYHGRSSPSGSAGACPTVQLTRPTPRLLRNRGEIDLEIERLRRRDPGPGDAGGRVRRDHSVVVADERADPGARGDAPQRGIEARGRDSPRGEGRAEVGAGGEREIDEAIGRIAAIVEGHVDPAGRRDAHLRLEPVAPSRRDGDGAVQRVRSEALAEVM